MCNGVCVPEILSVRGYRGPRVRMGAVNFIEFISSDPTSLNESPSTHVTFGRDLN
jgi:hypothetical protein